LPEKIPLPDQAEKVDITLQNLSVLKTASLKPGTFSTLEASWAALDYRPGDILAFVSGKKS
jgi:putative transcriptional regulator